MNQKRQNQVRSKYDIFNMKYNVSIPITYAPSSYSVKLEQPFDFLMSHPDEVGGSTVALPTPDAMPPHTTAFRSSRLVSGKHYPSLAI
jgi:hypothetical protein